MLIPHANPLSGKPKTVESIDRNGNPQFTIKARELTPGRAKAADGVRTLLGLILTLACLAAILDSAVIDIETVIVNSGVAVACFLVLACAFRMAFRRKTTIVMSTETIGVRRWHGWQRYDRNMEHQFALLVHDKAQAEEQQHEYESRRAAIDNRVIRKAAYYAESFHVVLVYAGHRKDLLCVYGQKEAVAIIARLQYCDRRLNEAASMGGGIIRKAGDEWTIAPGGLDRA